MSETGRSKQSIAQRRAFGIGCKYDSHSRLQLERIGYQRDELEAALAAFVALSSEPMKVGDREVYVIETGDKLQRAMQKARAVLGVKS